MGWRGKKGIQRWPCYIWGETQREREGQCAGLGSTGRGRRSSRLPEKKGARGGGGVGPFVTIIPEHAYPPPHKTEQDPMTEHPIRPDLHPATTVIDQPTSVLKGSHYRAFDISKLCLVVLNVKYWCSVQLGGRGGE